jgi:predicted small lipoprotein YifL
MNIKIITKLTYIILIVLLISSCGQKGPLYLPTDPKPDPKDDSQTNI